jgi:hypothetical protein
MWALYIVDEIIVGFVDFILREYLTEVQVTKSNSDYKPYYKRKVTNTIHPTFIILIILYLHSLIIL